MNFGIGLPPEWVWPWLAAFVYASWAVIPLLIVLLGVIFRSNHCYYVAAGYVFFWAAALTIWPGGIPCGHECYILPGLG
jgi:hypothetical protein